MVATPASIGRVPAQQHRAEIPGRESGVMSSRKTGGHEPGCGGFTCPDLTLCVQWSIWMFGVAMWLVSVTPSTSQAHGTSDPVLVDPGAAACGPIAVLASARGALALNCRINRTLLVARSGRTSSAGIGSAARIGRSEEH